MLRSKAYPLVTQDKFTVYDQFRLGPLRGPAGQYPDLRSYVRPAIGGEPYQFAADIYNPQRSTWTDGAIKSSINTIDAVFGMNSALSDRGAVRIAAGVWKGEETAAGIADAAIDEYGGR